MSHRRLTVALAAGLLVATMASAASPPAPLRVLVTNDDGVAAPGIAAVVAVLRANPNLQVTVIAPAMNQSGTGDRFTTTPIDVSPSSAFGAFPSTAVAGFPADSVWFGLTHALAQPPDLVVSGINQGQNIAEVVTISGTVGAALTAARQGIPGIAVSQGLGAVIDYTEAAQFTGELVERFRRSRGFRAKLTNKRGLRHALVLNVNFPTCPVGSTRGVKVVPIGRATVITGYTAVAGATPPAQRWQPTLLTKNILASDCTSTVQDPASDIDAFNAGFASVTPLEADLTSSQRLRSFRFLEQP